MDIILGSLWQLKKKNRALMIGNTVSQQTVKEWPRDRNWLTTDNQPNPGKVSHSSAVYIAYSFQTVVQVLLRPTRTR